MIYCSEKNNCGGEESILTPLFYPLCWGVFHYLGRHIFHLHGLDISPDLDTHLSIFRSTSAHPCAIFFILLKFYLDHLS